MKLLENQFIKMYIFNLYESMIFIYDNISNYNNIHIFFKVKFTKKIGMQILKT